MPSENSVVEAKRGIFSNFPGFRSKDRNPPLADTPEKVVEDLERSLTKDDPLIHNNTFNGDDEHKGDENKFVSDDQSEDDIDKDKDKPVESEENAGPQEESGAEVEELAPVKGSSGHKKLKLPKFKIPKFRKKHNEQANLVKQQAGASGPSGTEEGVTDEEAVKSQDEGIGNELCDVHSDEQPSTSKPAVTSEDNIDEDEDRNDDDQSDSKPVPKPRTLPEPIITKTADEMQGDDVIPVPTTKKRKKKKRVPKANRPIPDLPEDPTPTQDEQPITAEDQADDIPVVPDDQQDTIEAGPSSSSGRARTARRKARKQQKKDDGLVLGVTVHQSDHLRASLKYISHPVVRVSLVDGSTGQFLLKSDSSRSVTSYYESDAITHVLPIMTQPYDFRSHQSILPKWEETLIFNESFDSLITSLIRQHEEEAQRQNDDATSLVPVNPRVVKPSPMVFFVIRDFVSVTKANNVRKGKDDVDKGWHNVAWAFLKLVGSTGQPNTGRRVRLQLFHPPRMQTMHVNEQQAQSELAYFWWRDVPRREYPATLYVTLKALNRPDKMDPTSRSMFATQPEVGNQSFKQLHSSLQFADGTKSAMDEEKKPKWSRLPGQTCKIPNAVALRLWSGSDGAFSIRFSNSGTRLAVACKHENSYPILLYGIPGGAEMGCLNNHQQLVYDIQWSNNDDRVVSASADGTAQVWDLKDKSKSTHTLPHPAYVYTAAFHPTAQHVVATGGYDCVIRVWNVATATAEMLQELDGHKSFINSIVFDKSGLTLYSADSNGMILAWNCHAQEKVRRNYKVSWTMKTKYEDRELSGVCINNIQVHPRNNKLLLHCRDSVMRILDVRIHTLLRLNGAVSHRQHLRSALTSCGSFVISGSEDGCAYVWNSDSGDQVAIYNELGFSRSVRDVNFHPHDHMVAFCCFSSNMPVLVYVYDKSVAAIGAGVLPVVGTSQQARDLQVESLDRSVENRNTSKVQRIKNQLDQVMTLSSPRGPAPLRTLSPTPGGSYLAPNRYSTQDPYSVNDSNLTWGSTFDSTLGSSLEPAYLSPHASPEARAIARHLAANQPKAEVNQGWRPTFTAVGGSPYRTGVGPDVSVAVDDQGRRSLQVTTATPIREEQTVVALYDYQASRSDDLTMYRGDVIKVLYKDGESWWFGERLSDGRQGYFPSNYVALDDNESVASKLETRDQQPEVMFGVPEQRPMSSASDVGNKSIHALKMLDGKLQFYSHSESDGEQEKPSASTSISSRQRRRQNRSSAIKSSDTAPQPDIGSREDDTPQPRTRSAADTTPVPRSRTRKRSPRQATSPARPLPVISSSQLETKPKEIVVEEIEETKTEDVYATVQKGSRSSSPRQKVTFESDIQPQMTSVQAEVYHPPPQPPTEDDPAAYPTVRPRMGVLEAVKSKLAENDSLLSKTVIGGPEFNRDDDVRGSRGPLPTSLAPIMTSTATKAKKSKSRRNRSSSRGRAPKVLVTVPSEERSEEIPMLELVNRKLREVGGTENHAYDHSSEV
uniref:Jouberin-like n=1 Tax=Phallusia mammillata TaxID=59560 RepID=A0A6F9D5W6_9ASCI|nr:jouberin-like [Phallusia mammillata]